MDLTQAGLKQFTCEKPILEPYFRYIPDRAIMQKMITRAANMKDDLAEFGLFNEEVQG